MRKRAITVFFLTLLFGVAFSALVPAGDDGGGKNPAIEPEQTKPADVGPVLLAYSYPRKDDVEYACTVAIELKQDYRPEGEIEWTRGMNQSMSNYRMFLSSPEKDALRVRYRQLVVHVLEQEETRISEKERDFEKNEIRILDAGRTLATEKLPEEYDIRLKYLKIEMPFSLSGKAGEAEYIDSGNKPVSIFVRTMHETHFWGWPVFSGAETRTGANWKVSCALLLPHFDIPNLKLELVFTYEGSVGGDAVVSFKGKAEAKNVDVFAMDFSTTPPSYDKKTRSKASKFTEEVEGLVYFNVEKGIVTKTALTGNSYMHRDSVHENEDFEIKEEVVQSMRFEMTRVLVEDD